MANVMPYAAILVSCAILCLCLERERRSLRAEVLDVKRAIAELRAEIDGE
jgi:hypothetical protein